MRQDDQPPRSLRQAGIAWRGFRPHLDAFADAFRGMASALSGLKAAGRAAATVAEIVEMIAGDGTGGSPAKDCGIYAADGAGWPARLSFDPGQTGAPGACSAATTASPISKCSRWWDDFGAIRRFAGEDHQQSEIL
jgi:hypothetical protein